MYKKILLLVALAMLMTASKPITCPGGWLRNDGWTKDRTDSVEISVETYATHRVVRFTPAIGITITKVCVNGAKRILRYTAPDVVVDFQVDLDTYLFDAAVKFKGE